GGERALGPGYPSWISWAPDSNVLIVAGWEPDRPVFALFSVDESTGSRHEITSPPPGVMGDLAGSLSPDGRTMAFIRCLNQSSCDLYPTPSGRQEAHRLTHDECPFSGFTWMPDGRSIVYSSRRRGPYMLWQVNASGGNPEQVPSSADDERAPRAARSPSGKAI